MKRIYFFAIIISSVVFFPACKKKQQRIEKDLPKMEERKGIEVKIHRFDEDFLHLNTIDLNKSVKELYGKYPQFLPLFVSNVLNINPKDTLQVAKMFGQFVLSSDFKPINEKVMQTFGDVTDIEKETSQAFTKINRIYPQIRFPQIYFFVSGFNRAVIATDSVLGVGSDFYLGADYKPYDGIMYKYLLQNMNRNSMAVDLISTVLFNNFRFDGKENNLLNNILHRGKVIYLLSQVMPGRKQDEIIGYTKEQLKWCEENEKNIWKTMVGNKDLFSTNVQLIRKYIADAPFTAPVSQDSPGRLGDWIGWQIIESYMDKNSGVSIRQLMEMNDYQKMLEQSGYRP